MDIPLGGFFVYCFQSNWNKWSVGFCGGRKNRGLGEKALEH